MYGGINATDLVLSVLKGTLGLFKLDTVPTNSIHSVFEGIDDDIFYLWSRFTEKDLGPVPVYEGVAVIAAKQLGNRDHRHVLLQTKVGVDQPSQLTTLESYF